MNTRKPEGPSVDEIMRYWSKCGSVKDTAEHFEQSYRVVEQMVSRYSHRYERAFNFPHITHAKRFGA
jgi:hypothetical protein